MNFMDFIYFSVIFIILFVVVVVVVVVVVLSAEMNSQLSQRDEKTHTALNVYYYYYFYQNRGWLYATCCIVGRVTSDRVLITAAVCAYQSCRGYVHR